MFKNILILFVLFTSFLAKAQLIDNDFCGYQKEVDRILKRNPQLLEWQNNLYKEAMNEYFIQQNNKRNFTVSTDTVTYTIPVVFHVLYNSNSENIDFSYIQSQMDELNLAFNHQTRDTQRIRPIFKPVGGDTKIRFVLATVDPSGNQTNGVTRTFTNKTTFSLNTFGQYSTDMKYTNRGGKTAWDPTKYMNVWICNMRFPNQVSMTLGFATPPTNAPNWNFTGATKDTTDLETGVVCHYSTIGKNHPLAIGNNIEAKTMVHEVGHYLGLRHTWGDAPNTSQGCSVDDGIFDTPNTRTRNYSCTGQNTCTESIDDKPDMTENYMDYSLDGCAAMFTKQQGFMMRFVLNKLRTGLPKREIAFDTTYIISPNTTVKLYPNPVLKGGSINIEIQSPQKSEFEVSLIDMNSKQVITKNIRSNQKESVLMDSYSTGFYALLVKSKENGKFVHKQIVVIE
jgi:hypothetical protein